MSFVERGVKPVYLVKDPTDIVALPPRELVEGGVLRTSGSRLYVVDVGTGVHIYDNGDPTARAGVSFVQVYGVTKIAVDGNLLYANNFTDLVTIDVTNPKEVIVLDRDPDLFEAGDEYPPNHRGYFECYDPTRGYLIGWREASLKNPDCRT